MDTNRLFRVVLRCLIVVALVAPCAHWALGNDLEDAIAKESQLKAELDKLPKAEVPGPVSSPLDRALGDLKGQAVTLAGDIAKESTSEIDAAQEDVSKAQGEFDKAPDAEKSQKQAEIDSKKQFLEGLKRAHLENRLARSKERIEVLKAIATIESAAKPAAVKPPVKPVKPPVKPVKPPANAVKPPAKVNADRLKLPVMAAVAASATPEAERVHVIIAAHTGQTAVDGSLNQIRGGARANSVMMKNLLAHQSRQKANPIMLTGPDFDHAKIISNIRGLSMGASSTDTIVFYIACHGGTDAAGQHALVVPNSGRRDGLVTRLTYLNELRRKGARQVVMISDSCSNALAVTLPSAAAAVAAPAQTPTHLLSALLLHQSGVYDFGGSRPPQNGDRGEFGAYYDDGGVFTNAFFDASVYCQNSSEGWNSLFVDASNRMPQGEIKFQGGLTQQGQHPFAFPVR